MIFTQKHKDEILIALEGNIYWDSDLSEKSNLFANRQIYNLIKLIKETKIEVLYNLKLTKSQRNTLLNALDSGLDVDNIENENNQYLEELYTFFAIKTTYIEGIIKEELIKIIGEKRVKNSTIFFDKGGLYINIAREFKDGNAGTIGLPTFISSKKIEQFLETKNINFLY